MKYCTQCGSAVGDGEKFCSSCGAPVASRSSAPERDFFDTKDSTGEFEAADIESNTALAVLSYIGPLVLIPIFAGQNSPYVKFHARQGLWLLLAELVCTCVPVLGWLAAVAPIVFSIIGIVNAAQKKAKLLPLMDKLPKLLP